MTRIECLVSEKNIMSESSRNTTTSMMKSVVLLVLIQQQCCSSFLNNYHNLIAKSALFPHTNSNKKYIQKVRISSNLLSKEIVIHEVTQRQEVSSGLTSTPEEIQVTTPERPKQASSRKNKWNVGRRGYNVTLLSECNDNITAYIQAVERRVFDTRISQVVAFIALHDHCRVPYHYESESPDSDHLGRWVAQTRKKYREGKLPQQFTDELNALQFDWNLKVEDPAGTYKPHLWNNRIQDYIEFYNTFKHGYIPRLYLFNIKLGNWVWTQRYQYKKYVQHDKDTQMTSCRVQQLTALGFVFEVPPQSRKKKKKKKELSLLYHPSVNNIHQIAQRLFDQHWHDMYTLYTNSSNNTTILSTEKEHAVAVWAQSQRIQYRNNNNSQQQHNNYWPSRLNQKRIQLLNDIHFHWDEHDQTITNFDWMYPSFIHLTQMNHMYQENCTSSASTQTNAADYLNDAGNWWRSLHLWYYHNILFSNNNNTLTNSDLSTFSPSLQLWICRQYQQIQLLLQPLHTSSSLNHTVTDTVSEFLLVEDQYYALQRFGFLDWTDAMEEQIHDTFNITTTTTSLIGNTQTNLESTFATALSTSSSTSNDHHHPSNSISNTTNDISSTAIWKDMYTQLDTFYKLYNHTYIPLYYPPNPKLGYWVHSIRKQHPKSNSTNKTTLSTSQTKLLKLIHFFDVDATSTNQTTTTNNEYDVATHSSTTNEIFHYYLNEITKLQQATTTNTTKNSTTTIPSSILYASELGNWIRLQHKYIRLWHTSKEKEYSILTENQVRLLVDTGIDLFQV